MNTPVEVLITLPLPEDLIAQLRAVSPRLKITALRARQVEDVSTDLWSRVEILYTDSVLPTPEQAPHLRWIQIHYAGIDHALQAEILQKPEVMVTTLSGVVASKMAEFILLMLLALGHRLPELIANQKRAEWPRDRWEKFSPRELRESTVGIVGYGSIGREVARLLNSFHARVLATKRDAMHPEDTGYMPEGHGDPAGELVYRLYPNQALRSMLKECDFVVVTVPLSPETRHLIGAEELAVLKPSAYLVDASRGGVIEPSALINALKERRLAGAALDVFSEEPLPADSPLWKMPNVLITPHVAGITPHYDRRAMQLFAENLERYLAGLPLYNRFERERGY